jgi:hypothetical protein
MSKLTAVEILELKLLGIVSFDSEVLRNKYKEQFRIAKEMEKEQIENTWIDATPRNIPKYEEITKEYAKQYYNETYKKDK